MKYIPFILGSIFFAAGLSKAFGIKAQKLHFKHWNLPLSVMYTIGVLEVIAGIALFIEPAQYTGAVLSSFIMSGAVVTCLIVSDYKRILLPFSLLVLSLILLYTILPSSMLTLLILMANVSMLVVAAILWAYPAAPMNTDREIELLDEQTPVMHQFTKILNVNYHYVTAGNEDNEVIVMIHGAPESWYAWNQQIIALSKQYFVIALDMKPYGQTEKDLDGDHSFPHIANEVKALMDAIQIDKFHLAAHDRGVIAADHLLSKEGMEERVISYIRMQQSFDQPHGEPLPPHALMGSFIGTMAYKLRFGLSLLYRKSKYVKKPIDKKILHRLIAEFRFKGIAQAMPLSFKTTSFPNELKDRQDYLFGHMTMPVLILQGRLDPGQHPEEYENSHEVAPNVSVRFINASHFFHNEVPEEANQVMIDFFKKYGLQ